LKRWLKLYDEKANRLDVARCLAELNLVGGDLLQILAAWPENATDDRLKAKIALACVELLVPLTWPIERHAEMTINHHRHVPYLQLAQVGYKRAIINYDGARILHTAVRVALPSMAEAQNERSARDNGIIKLVLYFLRNMAMIAPPPGVEYEGDEAEISRSATIDAFHYQDIFHVLLTVASTMGEDFSQQDVVLLEVLFHLIKGVDIEKLFMDEAQLDNQKVDELVGLRTKEAGMKRSYARTASTRHNRFGTMIWVKRDDDKVSSVSGQDALLNNSRSLAKMDKAKKFRPPRRPNKTETGPLDFSTPVTLNARANKQLRAFVEDFLDSGFNPLFQHLRKAMDREADRVMDYHPRQFFYLVSWFLEAERVRRKYRKAARSKKTTAPEDVDSFSLVASVLNQEMFITVNRFMENTYTNKDFQDLNAAMKCFTQILLTVQEMFDSLLEEDQEIAENILARIFYEETTHDRVANIARYYKDQGFGYLDSCTEMTHVYLRILENYSKQNTDLQVRSKRQIRRKKKAAKQAGEGEEGVVEDEPADSEDEDAAQAERTSRERKFDFKRFATRFLSQGCIDTFITFASHYLDLTTEQLKRCHRFFYRVAFKMEMNVMLFRVDIIALFYKMIKGPEGLDPISPMFKEWDELVKQLIRRCVRKLQERPQLFVEMLFSKTNSTAHFLEFGYDKQTATSKPRPAAELEIKGNLDWEKQLGVIVSVLLNMNLGDQLEWVKAELDKAATERRAWEDLNSNIAAPGGGTDPATVDPISTESDPKPEPPQISKLIVQTPHIVMVLTFPVLHPPSDTIKIALFKNGHLRLLLTTLGFKRTSEDDNPETVWTIPSSLPLWKLREALLIIKKNEFDPLSLDEDFIRRKSAGSAPRRRAAFDDEDDDLADFDGELLFPPGGPTPMPKSAALDALKKKRRARRPSGSDDDEQPGISDEVRAARAKARRQRELEKLRKIKSDLYIHDSDEEDDEEGNRLFFAREEELRKSTSAAAGKALLSLQKKEREEKGAGGRKVSAAKRKAVEISSDVDESGKSGSSSAEDDDAPVRNRRTRARSSSQTGGSEDDEEKEDEATDTPLSSPHRSSQDRLSLKAKRLRLSSSARVVRSESPEEEVAPSRPEPKEWTMEDIALSQPSSKAAQLVENGEEDDDDAAPVARAGRRRVTTGFVLDDSDEE
jgi:replication fork protection complex subunit Tof1/Swi1